ncbi:MmcQ/YjbR family DNA-binding protein [Dysgonomonas sp. 216]|uniref:MmcQ/YjbR family DNA-binding protein n=1 Tax=Dysgonomonas sp. 216 TaxID=2302934 RepID=UPI0013CF60B3|nr:MmcQ/YjbR family DNA-binding protein [Dysgonomonas sp. 216]NDW17631.1 MmcQ/YjbR family DNA-binding protein [Dysgonomonas sp. 216]
MNIEELREYCISIKGASESTPFLDDSVLVFKVMDKMFAYVALKPKDGIFRVNMKCIPERSAELREQYPGVERCANTRSLTWNSIQIESDIPDGLIKELIDHSVAEVIKALPKKKQEEYHNL